MSRKWNGQALKQAREGLAISQHALAVLSGAQDNQIGQWERGVAPGSANLVNLLDGLNIACKRAGVPRVKITDLMVIE